MARDRMIELAFEAAHPFFGGGAHFAVAVGQPRPSCERD